MKYQKMLIIVLILANTTGCSNPKCPKLDTVEVEFSEFDVVEMEYEVIQEN
jgi:hypothetical protein